MSIYNERVNKTLVEAMLHHDSATGMVAHTLPALRKTYGEECVMEKYTSCLRVYHDYPEKEGYDLFEVGIRFDPNPSLFAYSKWYEWVPFLPVYVERGSTEVEIRKAFQSSVESYKSFDLKVGSEVIIDGGEEGIFRVDIVTPLAVYGEFLNASPLIEDESNSADPFAEWVSWASITGVLS